MYLWIIVAVASVAAIAVAAAAYVAIPAPPEPPEADVVMPIKSSRPGCEDTDECYVPSRIMVSVGGQVTWVNEDAAFHSVTSGTPESPTGLFDSGFLEPYETYAVDFGESGEFEYYCTLHPWMVGIVEVG